MSLAPAGPGAPRTLALLAGEPAADRERVWFGDRRDMDVKIGTLTCQICEAHFEAKIHALSEPVDIYADWIDECEALNTGEL